MATTNPVYQVLVTSGNQAPLAAGNPVSALAVGQIGVFNVHNGLSLGAASIVGDTREIFIAVGIDPDGVGSLQDINKSAGQVIQVRNAKSYTLKGYVDDLPKIVDIMGFKAKCETDYAIKIELRNGEVYATNGYNQFAKTFNFKTGCCSDECVECGEGDCNELAKGLVSNVNNDPDGLILASFVYGLIAVDITATPTADGTIIFTIGTTTYTVDVLDADDEYAVATKMAAAINASSTSPYTAVPAGAGLNIYSKGESGEDELTITDDGSTGVTVTSSTLTKEEVEVADVNDFIADNPGVCLGIRLTSVPTKIRNYCSVNIKYTKLRATNLIVTTPEGFTCNGTVTTVQELQYSEGKGYDVKQLEYVAGGWNGKPGPYRVSETTGLARDGFVYFASQSVNYQILSLTYDQMSVGGWLEYLNNLETIVAIPCGDTTTLTGLVAILDAIFTQFQPKANDAALLDCDNDPTTELADNVNGISSLS